MCGSKITSVQSVKDLSVTVLSDLKFSQQCNEAVRKADRMLSLIKRNSLSRIKTLYYLYITVLLSCSHTGVGNARHESDVRGGRGGKLPNGRGDRLSLSLENTIT